MNRTRIKRNFYRYPKYYYTALRFIVEIYKAQKPKGVDNYEVYKTQRNYVMETFYNVYIEGKRKWRIPIKITIPITSKDRMDLKIMVNDKFWPYRKQVQGELLTYYHALEDKRKTGFVA